MLDKLRGGSNFRKSVARDGPPRFKSVGAVVCTLQCVVLGDRSISVDHDDATHRFATAFLFGSPSQQQPPKVVKDADARRMGVSDIAVPKYTEPPTILGRIDGRLSQRKLLDISVFEEK